MTPAEFYAVEHRGALFTRLHSGLDIKKWPSGTGIPSFVAGRVAAKGYHANYGYWLSVFTGDEFFTWSHMKTESPLDVNESVAVRTIIGPLGHTGLFAIGYHTHVSRGDHAEPWKRPTRDPLPAIVRALTAPAGGGGGVPHIPESKDEENMLDGLVYQITNPKGGLNGVYVRFGSRMGVPRNEAAAKVVIGLINHAIPESVPDRPLNADGSTKAGAPIIISQDNAEILAQNLYGAPVGTIAACWYAEKDEDRVYPRVTATGTGTTDLKPVLDAIAALASAVSPSSMLQRFRDLLTPTK